jgi:phenylalanyl-tRNA synthetase alpha chain
MSSEAALLKSLALFQEQAQTQIQSLSSLAELTSLSSLFLGKSGELSLILKKIAHLPDQEKRSVGKTANQIKVLLTQQFEEKKALLQQEALFIAVQKEHVDIFAPEKKPLIGSTHIITQTTQRLVQILSQLGFQHVEGPEVETDFFNFEAVNIPEHHPARDMQDTFFLHPKVVLRTHTTNVQMRALLQQKLPLRIISTGAVYRSDSDATHSPMFHQLECMMVDKGIQLSDLKGCLEYVIQHLFNGSCRMRMRSSFFPFVKPGIEVDISCFFCEKKKQSACKVCKQTGWIEVLGAGMVHPHLFALAKTPPEMTGFAFGVGIERIAMLLHQIPDLRLLYGADTRFLKQFTGE